jgi:hypothetical protein
MNRRIPNTFGHKLLVGIFMQKSTCVTLQGGWLLIFVDSMRRMTSSGPFDALPMRPVFKTSIVVFPTRALARGWIPAS